MSNYQNTLILIATVWVIVLMCDLFWRPAPVGTMWAEWRQANWWRKILDGVVIPPILVVVMAAAGVVSVWLVLVGWLTILADRIWERRRYVRYPSYLLFKYVYSRKHPTRKHMCFAPVDFRNGYVMVGWIGSRWFGSYLGVPENPIIGRQNDQLYLYKLQVRQYYRPNSWHLPYDVPFLDNSAPPPPGEHLDPGYYGTYPMEIESTTIRFPQRSTVEL